MIFLFLASYSASAAPGIVAFELVQHDEENVLLLTVTNEAGHWMKTGVHGLSKTQSVVIASVVASSSVPDKISSLVANDLVSGDLDVSAHSGQSPLLVQIPYDAADKALYDGDTNAFPLGVNTYQAHGPERDFYIGKYEVSNAEFCRFLNDAQAHTNDERGANMHFSTHGYVVFDPSAVDVLKPTLADLYDIAASMDLPITYSTNKAIGERYSVRSGYDRHPVMGVSWYGALKYCNWLTVDLGVGGGRRAYTEGVQSEDWHPVTATNWPAFTETERRDWVAGYDGYRLPMLGTNGWGPSAFNELFKVSSWNGVSNVMYGFGRDTIDGSDANYKDSGDPFDNGGTPQGFYDGLNQTVSNDNWYGVYDLVGNVSEWTDEPYEQTSIRFHKGGCFRHTKAQLDPYVTNTASAHTTIDFIGFRVAQSVASTNPPLVVYPSGVVTSSVNYSMFLYAVGGGGYYSWSIADTNIGTLHDMSGSLARYELLETNTTQFITVTDSTSTLTTTVVQIWIDDLPPLP